MGIYLRVEGDEEIARKFGNEPYRAGLLHQLLDAETTIIHGTVVPLTPVGVTSLLRGSWATEIRGGGMRVVGIVGNPLVYAPVIERGRTPGARMPPPDAIAAWVSVKLGEDADPFVVARSIGRKGIKGRRMLQKAEQLTLPLRLDLRRATISRIVSGA